MGLFKSKSSTNKKAATWLEEADLAYTLALASKNAALFIDYGSPELVREMMERINLGEEAYEGLLRYATTSWSKIGDSQVKYLKTVEYQHVHISRGVTAPMGDDYKEVWTLIPNGSGWQVTDMRRVADEC